MLRIPPSLHAWLRKRCSEEHLSLNEYCMLLLSAPTGPAGLLQARARAVRHAASLFGEWLIGMLVFGSWARGEVEPSSDVDLLVVLEPGCPLTRELYRLWDEKPVQWQGRAVEPHFVHLPNWSEGPSGVWAEAAVDGLVLFEKELRISRVLIRLRRQIAAGRLIRKVVHGQPYWAEAV